MKTNRIPPPAAGNTLNDIETALRIERNGLLGSWPSLRKARPGASAAEKALIEKAGEAIAGLYIKLSALAKELRRLQRGQSKARPKAASKLSKS
jgi:hypothetical protein